MKGKAAAKSDKRLIVLNDFFRDQDTIFFYNDKRDLAKVFGTVIDPVSGLNGHSTLYVYPREKDMLKMAEHYNKNKKFYHFPILDRKYKKLFVDDIKNFEKRLFKFLGKFQSEKGAKFRLLIDFENTASEENLNQILQLKNKSKKKSKNLSINQIFAFDINSLTDELIQKLSKTEDRFVITTSNDYMILSSFIPYEKNGLHQLESIAYEDIEDRVKKSLDVIIYSILQNSSLCGFNIIKNIVQNFNVLLSQGTVYPILYNLTKKGYLNVETQSDNRTRVYKVTDEGKKYFKAKIRNFTHAQERVMAFVQNQSEVIYDE